VSPGGMDVSMFHTTVKLSDKFLAQNARLLLQMHS